MIKVILSTRPEIDTRTWDNFESFSVNGMNLNQARSLIAKVQYPEDLKTKFLELMNEEFFNQHLTFLSIPLLCTLMLITFNKFHEIPSRITVFYEQAFETLYRSHDTSKEGFFKREFLCNLPSDRFKSIFSAFCYRTLVYNQVSFTDEQFKYHLTKAATVSEVDVNIDDYASDLVSSVCMMMRDGLNLHFIHRSFQDYFAALYILRYRGNDNFEVYDRVLNDMFVSNVFEMAADIDLQTLEREWALPAVKAIDSRFKRIRKIDRPAQFFKSTFHSISVISIGGRLQVSGWSWLSGNQNIRVMQNLSKIYENDIGRSINPNYITGDLLIDGYDVCSFPNMGIKIPKSLDTFCETGFLENVDEEGSVEISVSDISIEWINITKIKEKSEDCLTSIENLHKMLKARIKKRDKISILD